jgi:hypothetical protein
MKITYFKAKTEEDVAEFVRAFQASGLARVKARLEAHARKTLKEVMIIEGTWDSFCKSSKEFGKIPEESVINLENRARAIK